MPIGGAPRQAVVVTSGFDHGQRGSEGIEGVHNMIRGLLALLESAVSDANRPIPNH